MKVLKVDIRPVCRFPYFTNEEVFQEWLADAVFSTNIFFQIEEDQEVHPGDYMRCIFREDTLVGPDGKVLGETVEEDGSLLQVIRTQEDYGVATIVSFGYKHFQEVQLPERIYSQGTDVVFMDLFPIRTGQNLIHVANEESQAWATVRQIYERITSAPEHLLPRRELDALVAACDDYLGQYPAMKGAFAGEAMYQKGFALAQLGQWQEAVAQFQGYLNTYPDGYSAQGAESWIMEAYEQLAVAPVHTTLSAAEIDAIKTQVKAGKLKAALALAIEKMKDHGIAHVMDLELAQSQLAAADRERLLNLMEKEAYHRLSAQITTYLLRVLSADQ